MQDSDAANQTRVYVDYLHISSELCPPNYYTLLGVSTGAVSDEIVGRAAKERADTLRKGVPGELHLAARKILKRIASARICLSDASSRAAYDAKLQKSSNAVHSKKQVTSPQSGRVTQSIGPKSDQLELVQEPIPDLLPELDSAMELEVGSESMGVDLGPSQLNLASQETNPSALPIYLGVGGGALCVISLCLALLFGGDSEEELVAEPSTVQSDSSSVPIRESNDFEVSEDGITLDPTQGNEESSANIPVNHEAVAISETVLEASTPEAERSAAAIRPKPESNEKSTVPVASAVKEAPPVEIIPLNTLRKSIELPPSQRVANELNDAGDADGSVELGPISEIALAQLQLQLSQPLVPKHDGVKFYLDERNKQDAETVWPIHVKAEQVKDKEGSEVSALDAIASGFDETVGSIYSEDGVLKFRWGTPAHGIIAEQLRNTILILTSGDESHRIQMRANKKIDRFVSDLSERNRQFPIDGESLPSSDAMKLKVENIALNGVNFELQPSDGIVEHKGTLRIKLLDWDGDAELLFAFTGSSEKPILRVSARYKIGRKRKPLTPDDVVDAIGDMNEALASGRAKLRSAESAASSLPGQISRVMSSRQASDAAIRMEANRLTRRLNSARGTIRRMQNSLPEIRSNLRKVEALKQIAARFHQQGGLDFSVYVPCDDGDLMLLSAKSGNY